MKSSIGVEHPYNANYYFLLLENTGNGSLCSGKLNPIGVLTPMGKPNQISFKAEASIDLGASCFFY